MRISDWSSDVCSSDLQGNKPTGVPEYMLNANVEWDVPFLWALTLTGRVVNTGKQAANLTNTLFLPSWTRLDLGVRYVAVVGDRPLTLRAGVDNVANKRYWASAFDSFRPDLQQGAPRTFKARSEEHTSELQSLTRTSYAVFCLQKNNISANN